MGRYMALLLTTSLVMSAVILGLILFNRLFSSKYPAKWRYYIWLIVLFGLLIPFKPNIALPFEPVKVPDSIVENTPQSNINDMGFSDFEAEQDYPPLQLAVTDSAANVLADSETTANALPKSIGVFILWLAGMLLMLALNLLRHKKFLSLVRRWGTDIEDDSVLSAMRDAQSELRITQPIRLKMCKVITSPMLTGFIKPMILLPEKAIHEDELMMILKHELIHYKRKDLWMNLLITLTSAVHWFNPFVYIMANMIRNDCETSCDEAVLGNSGTENRRVYGEAIIGVIGTKKIVRTALSTNFYGGKNTMKKRILLIMNTSKKRISLAVLCGILVVTATLVSGSVFALGVNGTEIEKAKEIALAEAGGGTVVQCELEYENGVQVYEIKVINGDTEYELDIGVEDYAIYKSEAKTIKKKSTAVLPAASDITSDKAQEIALEKTGGGEVTKWELDYKDGIKVYEIEVINGGTKYSMEIGAVDGQVYNYKEKLAKTNAESQSPKKTLPETVITAEKAKEIAIAETCGGTVKEYELDYEKGVWIYEIEVIFNGVEYDVDINAETGEVIKCRVDD